MDVALHLSRRERQRPRLDRRHRQAGPGRSAAVMQFLDQLLCPLAGHPWRQKLAEWSKGLRSHGLDSEMDHAKTSQGWTLKQDAFGWNVVASRPKATRRSRVVGRLTTPGLLPPGPKARGSQ